MTVRSGNDDGDWVFLVVQSVPVIVNGYEKSWCGVRGATRTCIRPRLPAEKGLDKRAILY